jgi:polar amino acid transport system substrate-binding protein
MTPGRTAAGVVSVVLAVTAAGCSSSKSATTASTTVAPTTASTASSATTAAGGGSSSATLPAKYQSAGINVALDATYPPDEFTQGGQIVGLDADLMNAVGKQLGVKINLVNATFDTIIPGLLDGKFDVGASSFTDNKQREQQVDFVDYFQAGEGFYVNANSTLTFNGLSSLCGHSVSVETGTTEETDAQTQAKKCSVHVLSFADQNQANLAVTSGRADVGFADSQVAGYIVSVSKGQFKLTGTAFAVAPYGLAVDKGTGLAPAIQGALQALMANGTYTQILSKWGVQSGAVTSVTLNGATS